MSHRVLGVGVPLSRLSPGEESDWSGEKQPSEKTPSDPVSIHNEHPLFSLN